MQDHYMANCSGHNYFLGQLELHSLEIGVFTVFQGNRGDSHILILFFSQEIEHLEFSTSIHLVAIF
jgi:hypothetical protein